MSDRRLITALMAKNRTYGPELDAHMPVLANLDGIIQGPKRLRAVTMLYLEQFDCRRIRFAERVAERALCRLFWNDDLRASDPRTLSRPHIRHTLLMSLIYKRGGRLHPFGRLRRAARPIYPDSTAGRERE